MVSVLNPVVKMILIQEGTRKEKYTPFEAQQVVLQLVVHGPPATGVSR
jgi:hypothetical protein